MTIRRVLAVAVMSAVAISGYALTPEHEQWGKSPASYFFTKEEAAQWKTIKTDDEAAKFIALFWARRDPTPQTPRNEFREEFDARVASADAQFTTRKQRGSASERGKLLILLGKPTRVTQSGGEARGPINPSDVTDDTRARQTWLWEGERATELFSKPRVLVAFTDINGSGDYRLEMGGGSDVRRAQEKIIAQAVKRPDLTEVPTFTAAAAPAAPRPAAVPAPVAAAPAAPAAPATSFREPAFQAAVDTFRGGKSSAYKGLVTYTEMLAPTGEYYVPVQLYVPKAAGISADAVTTFFGSVQDVNGATVAVFEEPAKLSTSNGDLYFDRSLPLTPGTYTATFGLSGANNTPLVMATAPLQLKPIASDHHGVSRLILANDIHETDAAALPGTPYAFGKLKLVPKGDRVFGNKDELNYIVELFNFGIDEGTNLPKVQAKLELSGTAAGKTVKISSPLTEVVPLPLSGAPGPGPYLVISGIPLGQMAKAPEPGDYKLTVKLYDQVKKQNFTTEQTFTIVAAK
jgi:GWxTD domain-containing protein